jgi:predicted lipoprotein
LVARRSTGITPGAKKAVPVLNNLRSRKQATWAVVAVLAVALVVAMVLNTKFVSSTAGASGQPDAFSPQSYAEKHWPDLVEQIDAKAVDVTELAPVADADPAAAGKQFGQDLGAGSFAFPVKATGTVSAVDNNFITLSVPGMPEGDVVRIPVGMALNGAPIRDATGSIKYGDFANQSAYQDVANALKDISAKTVIASADPASLNGKQITVVGATATGGPAKAYSINPVTIEVVQ